MRDKLESFLASHPMPEKKMMRTSFLLVKEKYIFFRLICKKRGVKPAALINLFIEDFNEKYEMNRALELKK